MTASRAPLLGFHEGHRAAERMRELRLAAGLRQAELAARVGQCPSWVSTRESGGTRMSVADAERVAAALGTDLAGLTGEEPG